ncbi:Rrf2 family transcriptional regulator [Clostridium beijerinckii]|jgi:transcriptional regulator, BadM/Rrf2 family|nr:HTH-type transcriptional regulator CymR [Clostridium beijerinckii]OOM44551.1 HTH-type transcriptional regulator CymR [Clostridium beijerinckii]OOM45536.1 HTH-type transcriptional regulator CymR [Clostridium beijerinckii]OOM54410.1 HTH-type transcriptional regulator CymR [Clostridium beijerinckii]SQB12171.1 BadM/Rrf2 family transcriptional regulator [Clostridium beijerinckii]
MCLNIIKYRRKARYGDFMKISTKGRYGLRALIDICIFSVSEMVTVKSISERQGISERYLEQIFSSLRKGGIINAKKGAQGGYFLAKSSREFTIGDILNVLEGDLLLIDIENDENEIENFMSENLWNVINNKIINFFNSITLEDLVNDYKKYNKEDMYYI